MSFDSIDLTFEAPALEAVADKAIAMNIGARGLRSVMENLMMDVMYSVPSDPSIESVVIRKNEKTGEIETDIRRSSDKEISA